MTEDLVNRLDWVLATIWLYIIQHIFYVPTCIKRFNKFKNGQLISILLTSIFVKISKSPSNSIAVKRRFDNLYFILFSIKSKYGDYACLHWHGNFPHTPLNDIFCIKLRGQIFCIGKFRKQIVLIRDVPFNIWAPLIFACIINIYRDKW